MQTLSEKEQVSREIKEKIEYIRGIWNESCGRFAEISDEVDNLLIAKRNVERVLGMIKDYINIDKEVADMFAKLEDQEEIFQVYKKIKLMSFVRMSLIQKLDA